MRRPSPWASTKLSRIIVAGCFDCRIWIIVRGPCSTASVRQPRVAVWIVGVQATAARMSQETVAAQDMLTRFTQWQGREPESVAADTTYGNGEFLQWLADRSITPYMRTRDSIHRKRSPFYGPERFTYEPENNRYICPAGQPLNYGGRVHRNRAYNYIGTRKRCGPCSQRPQCTSAAFRSLIIHQNEPARQRARELVNTPEFAHAQRQRK